MEKRQAIHAKATEHNSQSHDQQQEQGMFTSRSLLLDHVKLPQPFLLLNQPQVPNFLGSVIQQSRNVRKLTRNKQPRWDTNKIRQGTERGRSGPGPRDGNILAQLDSDEPRPLEIKHHGMSTLPFLLLNQPQLSQFLRGGRQDPCLLGEGSKSQQSGPNSVSDCSYRRRGRPRLTPTKEVPQRTSNKQPRFADNNVREGGNKCRRVTVGMRSVNQLPHLENDQPQLMDITDKSNILDTGSKDIEEDETSASSGHSSMGSIDDQGTDDDSCTVVEDPTNGSSRKFLKPWNFGGPTKSCQFCSAVMWSEESVGRSSKKQLPKFNICCQKGKVKLPLLQDPPEPLKSLLEPNGGPRSTEFKRLIRSYNAILAFSSTGGTVDNSVNKGGGPYCFRLGGQNHHNIGSLIPAEGQQARFMQLYFYGGEDGITKRINALSNNQNTKLDPEIVKDLTAMVYKYNPLAQICKMARERISSENLQHVQLHLRGARKKDGRQYNLPTTDEVAALIVGPGENQKGCRDIIIHDRARGLRRISEIHPSLMALQYPIMYTYGEDGFRIDIKHSDADTTRRKKRKFVTMREYYAYRFQERRKDGKLITIGKTMKIV